MQMNEGIEPKEDMHPEPPKWRRLVPSWLRRLLWVDESLRYDGFISYSWAADRKVAEVIQGVLQDFLCPWYKIREKRIFRDLACLPAGATLENELKKRLDASEHLIILASPEAVLSCGMHIEVEHWLAIPRTGKVIIIVTSGAAETWMEIEQKALPQALTGRLSEPVTASIVKRRAEILADPNSEQLKGELIEELKQVLLQLHDPLDWGQLRGKERERRRRALTLLVSVLSLILTLIGVAGWQAFRAYKNGQEAFRQGKLASEQGELASKRATQLAAEARKTLDHALVSIAGTAIDPVESLACLFELQEPQTLWAAAVRARMLAQGPLPLAEVSLSPAKLTALSVSPTGRFVLLGDDQGKIWVWQAYASHYPVAVGSHARAIRFLVFLGSDDTIVSVSDDHSIKVWQLSNDHPIRTIRLRSIPIAGITYDRSIKRLALAFQDGSAEVFNPIASSNAIYRGKGTPIDSDGTLFFTSAGKSLAFNSSNNVRVWRLSSNENGKDIVDWQAILQEYGHGASFRQTIPFALLSPDGSMLLTETGQGAILWKVSTDDRLVKFRELYSRDIGIEPLLQATFSPDSRKLVSVSDRRSLDLWRLDNQNEDAMPLNRLENKATSIKFTPDGSNVVVYGSDGIVYLIPTKEHRPLRVLLGQKAGIQAVGFADRQQVAVTISSDSILRSWDLAPERGSSVYTPLRAMPGDRGKYGPLQVEGDMVTESRPDFGRGSKITYENTGGVLSACETPDHKVLTSSSFGVYLWEAGKQTPVWRARIEGSFAASPYCELIAAQAGKRAIHFMRVGGVWGPSIPFPFPIENWIFSPDSTGLATLDNRGVVRILSLGSMSSIQTLSKGDQTAVQFMRDRNRAITASSDGTVWMWGLNSLEPPKRIAKLEEEATAIEISPDDSSALFTLDSDVALVWLDSSGKSTVLSLDDEEASSAHFSPDGRYIVTAGGTAARVWTSDGARIAILPHPRNVTGARFGPSGDLVLTACEDGTARIWSMDNPALPMPLIGHRGPISDVMFTEGGEKALTWSEDGTVRSWELSTQRLLTMLRAQTTVCMNISKRRELLGETIEIATKRHSDCTQRYGAVTPP